MPPLCPPPRPSPPLALVTSYQRAAFLPPPPPSPPPQAAARTQHRHPLHDFPSFLPIRSSTHLLPLRPSAAIPELSTVLLSLLPSVEFSSTSAVFLSGNTSRSTHDSPPLHRVLSPPFTPNRVFPLLLPTVASEIAPVTSLSCAAPAPFTALSPLLTRLLTGGSASPAILPTPASNIRSTASSSPEFSLSLFPAITPSDGFRFPEFPGSTPPTPSSSLPSRFRNFPCLSCNYQIPVKPIAPFSLHTPSIASPSPNSPAEPLIFPVSSLPLSIFRIQRMPSRFRIQRISGNPPLNFLSRFQTTSLASPAFSRSSSMPTLNFCTPSRHQPLIPTP